MKLFNHIERLLERGTWPVFILLALAIAPNIILSFTEHAGWPVALLNIALPLAAYYLIAVSGANFGRTIWLFFPVFFLGAFQLVLLWLYGRSIIAVDMWLNLVTTNPGEVGELLGNMWPAITIVVLLYVPLLITAAMIWKRKMKLGRKALRTHRRRAWILAAAVAVFSMCCTWNATYDIFPVNVLNNARLAVLHTTRVASHDTLSRGFSFNAVATDSVPRVIVMVIGETSRGDHWGVNGYNRLDRVSTPGVPGWFFNFPRTLSESNTTHKSVPLLLSHLTPENYGDSIYSVRSVITAFREAGYSTAFVSMHRHNRSFIDFFGEEAHECTFIREPDGLGLTEANDLSLLDRLRDILSHRAERQLVVLHAYGSHFSYRDRYPGSFRRYLPDDYDDISTANLPALMNAYDNTISLTDSLLRGIMTTLADLGGTEAAMLYTSDHGEDMLDDDRGLFLHASPCPSFYQLYVPMFIWLSRSYADAHPTTVSALRSHTAMQVASNTVFTPTALTLAGITTPRVSPAWSLADPAFTPLPSRRYLNDHNKCVSLDQAGFMHQDRRLLNTLDAGQSLNGH